MEQEINMRIVLEGPTNGVDYGLQKGRGNEYETVQTQRSSAHEDMEFEFTLRVNDGKDGQPNFLGPFAQGPANGRFVYLDIGTYAGQKDTGWSRRLKIPLSGITWNMVKEATKKKTPLETHVRGRGGRDGGPTCGTIKPFSGWHVNK